MPYISCGARIAFAMRMAGVMFKNTEWLKTNSVHGEKGEKMGRAIDADALLKTLKFLANKKYNRELTTSYSNAYKEVMGFVKCAPTIEPTLQHVESVGEDGSALKPGQWVVNDNHHTCRCSCCESVELTDWALEQAKYCPHCGAKMDGVEE